MAVATWETSSSSAPYVTLTVTQSSQSIVNNTSTLSYSLVIHRPSNISSSASKSYSINVAGTTISGTTTIGGSGNKTIRSGSVAVSHNSDGTKSISFNFSLTLGISWSGSSLGTASASNSMTLTTIPRTSSLTANNGTLGTSQTLTINRASSSFTHTITYRCGNASGTIVNKTSSTSVSYTPALTLANQNTTGTTVSITFTLTTYSGSTSLGTATKTISCSMPASIKPTITNVVLSDPNSYYTVYSAYIKTKSKVRAVVTASTSYGSAIASYKLISSDLGTFTSSSNTLTSNVIYTSGTVSIDIQVTDKRGRTATSSMNINVLNYAEPRITTFNIIRCDENGTEFDQGDYCKLSYTYVITPLNNLNTKSLSYGYKKTTDSQYTMTDVSSENLTYSMTGSYIIPVSSSYTYNIQLVVSDVFTNDTKTLNLSAGFTLMNWLSNGLGMAFGKVAELSGYLEIKFKTMFKDELYMDNYSDVEKVFYFQNNASRENQTYVNDGVYPHFCKIYGGNGESPVGIGLWDDRNMKRILSYNDNTGYMTTEIPLYFNDGAGFESVALPSTNGIVMNSGYTCTGGYIYKWGCIVTGYFYFNTQTAFGSGNIANADLGTLVAKFRPKYIATLCSGNTGALAVGQINADGSLFLSATGGTISASASGSTASTFCLYGTWIADFTT